MKRIKRVRVRYSSAGERERERSARRVKREGLTNQPKPQNKYSFSQPHCCACAGLPPTQIQSIHPLNAHTIRYYFVPSIIFIMYDFPTYHHAFHTYNRVTRNI